MLQKRAPVLLFTLLSILSLFFSTSSWACTRVLKVDPDNAVMVGRNMDWLEDMHTDLRVYPRGMEVSGDVGSNPLEWTSKYGSIVATAYGYITTDGLNEAGLAAHILWLNDADYGDRDVKRPGLLAIMWIQFYLDNFKSVDEAVTYTQTHDFQLTPFTVPGLNRPAKLHLALDDASGDSAIFEYTEGKLHVFHSSKNVTMTNDPTYDKQLLNLKDYQVFGGNKPLPGTSAATDRFVRATYYASRLPKAASLQEEVAGVLSVVNNAAQPFAIPDNGKPYKSRTIWHTVSDLTNRVYYFQSTLTQNLISVSLSKFNLNAGSPTMKLDIPKHPELVGDVTSKFEIVD